jgi:hypothetical protein
MPLELAPDPVFPTKEGVKVAANRPGHLAQELGIQIVGTNFEGLHPFAATTAQGR